MAAPVLGEAAEPNAAISVTGLTSRFRAEAQATAVRAATEALPSTVARRERLTT